MFIIIAKFKKTTRLVSQLIVAALHSFAYYADLSYCKPIKWLKGKLTSPTSKPQPYYYHCTLTLPLTYFCGVAFMMAAAIRILFLVVFCLQ
jgi:hypothetical protein